MTTTFNKVSLKDVSEPSRFIFVFQDLLDKLSFLFSSIRPRKVVPLKLAIPADGLGVFPKSIRNPGFQPAGVYVCRFRDTVDPLLIPVSQPYVHWDISENGDIRIFSITGLTFGRTYDIFLEVFQ